MGDVACDPSDLPTTDLRRCRHDDVGRLVGSRIEAGADAFLALGDLQYENGGLQAFRQVYGQAFGDFKRRTYPIAGNHEWNESSAAGYFEYFGDRAGTARRPWRTFVPTPGWRVVLLDSNCTKVGGCGPRSRQGRWLAEVLRRAPQPCVVAAWHHPLFSSGPHGRDVEELGWARALWRLADEGGVDIVLNGHEHLYERFARRDGMQEFIVGTGGRSHYYVKDERAGSRYIATQRFGVLRLALLDGRRYQWRFLTTDGASLDRGSARCSNPAAR